MISKSDCVKVIRAGQHESGAYVACASFSQYGYAWLRDGAWTAYGMDCAGEHDSARRFYQWAAKTLDRQQPRLTSLLLKVQVGETPDEKDYLPTRFTLDGRIDQDTFWWDFQLDGYGTWLWGLVKHVHQTGNMGLWDEARSAVELTVSYLGALWDRPNYDCWEEHRDQIHTATLAAIYGGLKAVQGMEPDLVSEDLVEDIRRTILDQCVSPEGTFVKSIGNPAVDGSLLWIAVPYGVVDVHDPRFMNTLAKIEHDIHYPNGGVYRYAADTYYGGGEWILLTAWLAWTYQQLGMPDKADSLMTWIGEQATPTGELPEQVSQHVLDPSYYPPWVEKWGLIACPLLWSHAMWLVVKCGSSSLPHTPGT